MVKEVETYSNSFSRYYLLNSAKTNLYYAVWNIVIYAITALLIFLVSKNSLDIAIYLIIVPYLTTCTEKLNNMFDKTSAIENMRVDVDRVNLILNLNDKQLMKYGTLNPPTPGYNLGFVDVCYENAEKFSENYGKLTGVDISFKMQSINIIKGEKGSGKRLIFNMLRRTISPTSGKILLDNLDLYMYNPKTYKNHIFYCSANPSFVNGTVRENLRLICKNNKKINSTIKEVGLDGYFKKLKKGIDSQISEIKSANVLFFLGLARAILSDCKILMVYDFPESGGQKLKDKLKSILTKRTINNTIILFTHDDAFDDIASLIYEVKNDKVKMIKAK